MNTTNRSGLAKPRILVAQIGYGRRATAITRTQMETKYAKEDPPTEKSPYLRWVKQTALRSSLVVAVRASCHPGLYRLLQSYLASCHT